MLVVLQDALAQGTLAVVLPFSHLEHLSHSTEPCGELPKESPLALWQIGSGFLLAHPINAVNELCWDGMLLLPVLFQLCPHNLVVKFFWVIFWKLLALEVHCERFPPEFVVWHWNSVAVLEVLLGITVSPNIELGKGGEGGCSVIVLMAFHVFEVDGDWEPFHSPPDGVDQIEVRCRRLLVPWL